MIPTSPTPPGAATAADPWTGRLLGGRWRILSLLDDSGGMASVYLAEDERLPRKAVVKIPRTAQFNAEFSERFTREAHWHARVADRNVVHILDRGEEQGTPFLVLQYLPGGNLKAWTGRNPAFLADPRLHVESWLMPVAQALDAVAAQGIVHRDVKPSNILFDAAGQAYLSDFGIVKAGGEATMTGTGMFIGTLQFMSPEQCQPESKRALDGRSDQYGLAVTVYQVLTGWKYPVEDDTAVVYAAKFGHVPMRPTRDHDPRIPRAVDAAVMRALSPDRERRFASCVDFARAVLDGFGAAGLAPEPERSAPAALPPPLPPTPVLAAASPPTAAMPPLAGARSGEPRLLSAADLPTPAFPVRIWRWFRDLPDLALAAGLARLFMAVWTALVIGRIVGPWVVVAFALIPLAFVCGWGGAWGRAAAAGFLVLFVILPLLLFAAAALFGWDLEYAPHRALWDAGEVGFGWTIWGSAPFAWSICVGVAGGWLFVVCNRPPGIRHSTVVIVANVIARIALTAPALCWFVETTAVVISDLTRFRWFENLGFFACCCLPIPIVSLALILGCKARTAALIMVVTYAIDIQSVFGNPSYFIGMLMGSWILALVVVATAGPGPGSIDRPRVTPPAGVV